MGTPLGHDMAKGDLPVAAEDRDRMSPPDERGQEEARRALEAVRRGVTPPGGFDAWLHLVAVRVDSARERRDVAKEDGVRVATASLTAPNDPRDPLALFFIPPARVEAELRRLLEPLATDCRSGPGPAAGTGGATATPGVEAGGAAPPRLGPRRGPADGHGGNGPDGPSAGAGESGWLLQVGVSGMAYRRLAEAPAGFVPRYRLPRRTGAEPVWAADEPWWCPCRRLAVDPAGIARELAETLVRRLDEPARPSAGGPGDGPAT